MATLSCNCLFQWRSSLERECSRLQWQKFVATEQAVYCCVVGTISWNFSLYCWYTQITAEVSLTVFITSFPLVKRPQKFVATEQAVYCCVVGTISWNFSLYCWYTQITAEVSLTVFITSFPLVKRPQKDKKIKNGRYWIKRLNQPLFWENEAAFFWH